MQDSHKLSQSKTALRAELKLKLSQNLDQKSLDEKSKKLVQNLIHFLVNKPGIWTRFKPIQFEPKVDTFTLDQIEWAYPRILNNELNWFKEGPKGFSKNRFGILEPVVEEGLKINSDSIYGMLIPGLGFDRFGARLGRGQGFYDRFFSQSSNQSSNQICKVGVCFEVQLCDLVPTEDHDVRMDYIITEKQTLKI